MIRTFFTSSFLFGMRLLAHMPLALVRCKGLVLGLLLYALVPARRRVVWVNLSLCFPQQTIKQRRALALKNFIYFAQAWLDRSWLWHGSARCVQQRLRLTGAVHELQGGEPVVIFAPHFVGMDAGWTALSQQQSRPLTTIYTDQANKLMDRWIFQGRRRFGEVRLFGRADGVQPVVRSLRAGHPLYLLPDMNFGPEESIFVSFFGVQAATVPSLSRFAKLGKAKVVPVLTRMTRAGYEVQVLPAWRDFPTDDLVADTVLMNQRLEGFIKAMPAQYYWVHKRFKTRPAGMPAVYQ